MKYITQHDHRPNHESRSVPTNAIQQINADNVVALLTWYRFSVWIGIMSLVLLVNSGCSLTGPAGTNAPIVFQAPPDLDQVIQAVNANSDRIRQLHSSNVRLSVPGQFVSLRATLDFDRVAGSDSPGRFRLSGDALGSRQMDLGSNDTQYWLWIKQNKPPTVFWGYHNQFYDSVAQQFLPMPPSWLIDALGAVHIDERGNHEGPYTSTTTGLLQIRTRIPTPRGEMLRILEIDQQRALIVQQQIFDAQDRLLAAANSADFRFDNVSEVTLPHSIKVQLPPAGLAFDFQVSSYTINQPVIDPEILWAVPDIPEHRYLNLANPEDMRGVSLLGTSSADFYDRRQMTEEPVRPPPSRVGWRDRFGFSFLR